MQYFARTIRLLLSVGWILPSVIWPIWDVIENPVETGERCNYGGCWDNNRHHALIPFILFFPPGWAAFLTLILRDQRNLAWSQYFVLSASTLILTQIMSWMWMGYVYNVFLQQLALNPVDWLTPMLFGASLVGFVMIWFATHTALLRLPRPLGKAGEDWWFGGDPYPKS